MLDTTDYTGEHLEALVVLVNYQDWIIDKFRPFLKGRIVEFGAGLGTFSRRLLPYSHQLELVESSPRLIPRLTEAFSGEPRVNIVARTMESHLAEAPRASCDAIVMVNVLEHIEDDLLALRGCQDMLRPGGALLIFGRVVTTFSPSAGPTSTRTAEARRS